MTKVKKVIIGCAIILFAYSLFYYYQNRNKVIKMMINPIDSAEMVWVPAGYFTMGNSDFMCDGPNYASPQHKVYLDSYWIYKYEVTVKQYKIFCHATNRRMSNNLKQSWRKDDYPIVWVSWSDANAYAKWAGCTLPTEAEWEKAARGTDKRQFPWGNIWNHKKSVNSWDTRIYSPQPVGSIHEGDSPYGVSDMAGNVSEFCKDWYSDEYYKISPKNNPQGPDTGTYKVVRGANWNDDQCGYWGGLPTCYRTYWRYAGPYANVKLKLPSIGFRCVKRQ